MTDWTDQDIDDYLASYHEAVLDAQDFMNDIEIVKAKETLEKAGYDVHKRPD